MRGLRKDFWEKVETVSDWFWGSEKMDHLYHLCKSLFWPVLILWMLAALVRIILVFV